MLMPFVLLGPGLPMPFSLCGPLKMFMFALMCPEKQQKWLCSLIGGCVCGGDSFETIWVRPHRRQPTRLPSPWDSPGKNTGVGCPVQFNHSAYNWEQIKVHLQNIHDNASLSVQLLKKKLFKTFSKNLPSSPNLETFSLVQFSSVAQSCPTLCYPMNHSTPGNSQRQPCSPAKAGTKCSFSGHEAWPWSHSNNS